MKYFWLDWLLVAVVGLVVLVPKFDLLAVPGTTTTIRFEDFAVAGLYVIWLGWLAWRRKWPQWSWVHVLMLVVVLVGVLSTSWGMIAGHVTHPELGVLNVLRRIEYFGMFWVAFSWMRPERLKQYVGVLLGISLVVVIVAVLQFFGWLPMFSTWQGYSGQVLYFDQNFIFLISTFAGHYDLGGYLILMTPIAMAGLLLMRRVFLKLLLALLLAGYYFVLYFSYSRAAYVAIMGEMVIFFVLVKMYWLSLLPALNIARVGYLYMTGKFSRYDYDIAIVKTTPTPTVAAGHHVATVSATPVPHISPVHKLTPAKSIAISDDTAVTLDPGGAARIDVWKNAWNHFVHHPIFGTGYSSIGTGADNNYLRMVAETGLVGLVAFLALVGYVIYYFFRSAMELMKGWPRLFLLALVTGMVGLLAQAVLIDIFESSKVALLLWFLVGLGVVVARQPERV